MRHHDRPFPRRHGLPLRSLLALLAVAAMLAAGLAGVASAAPAILVPVRAATSPAKHVTHHRKHRHRKHAVRRKLTRRKTTTASASSTMPLTFGIYPGGAAGTVGPSGQTKPEVADLRLNALQQLRGQATRFTVHLYDSYTRPSDANAVPDWLATQIASYAANGLQVELVLTYRPANPAGDVAGFVNYVRARVRQLGPIPSVTDLQVTNEFNVTNAPNAADGWYPGANDALVQGIIAAHAEVVRGGFSQLKVGFNWAYQTGKAEQDRFRTLGRKGGAALKAAVDWVGIDAYPGTWGPSLASGSLSSGAGAATVDAMRTLRQGLMPLAGLSAATIHFSESGYPTGSGRTPAMQETVMRAAIAAIVANRTTYGVSDYRWFDLRDADSANPSFESQYGITRDDYSPKPAFFAYHDLIAANAG